MKKLILITITSFSFLAHAGGTIFIKGDLLQKCSDTNCQVIVGTQLYVLDMKKITAKQRTTLKSKAAGDTIHENISMIAITDVKDIK